MDEHNFTKTLFGVITIGKGSQFHRYPYQKSELHCLHVEAVAYTFKDHQADVDYWLSYIRGQIDAGN